MPALPRRGNPRAGGLGRPSLKVPAQDGAVKAASTGCPKTQTEVGATQSSPLLGTGFATELTDFTAVWGFWEEFGNGSLP
jgi:hypothetical protein